jgi:hypothetical protein
MLLASPGGWLRLRSAADPAEVADYAGTDRMMTFKVLQTLMDRGLVTGSLIQPTDA